MYGNKLNQIESQKTQILKNDSYPDTLLKNCGFSPFFFEQINKYTYVIEKNPMKKVNSTNAVVAIAINKTSKENTSKTIYESEDKETYEKEIEYSLKNNIVKNTNNTSINNNNDYPNIYDPQIHFKYLINNLNDDNSESSQVIKAYKSKHKSKFIKIYETNSMNFNEKNKYKLFHKCCYPGCNRTFSSSGWLKAHFKVHLKQIHNSLFCKLFQKILLSDKIQLMNHLNNNFLGLKSTNNNDSKKINDQNVFFSKKL